tara:strand:- start:4064 stop:5011 length:948 start_codon:yes stop_codon:yes gene_type:complete
MSELFHGSSGSSPTKISSVTRTQGTRQIIEEVWAGTPTQISGFTVPGYPSATSINEQGAVHLLTATYELIAGQSATSDTHTGQQLTVHWAIETVAREAYITEHPTITAQGIDTGDSALSYKNVTANQRQLLSELILSGQRLRWDDTYQRDGDTVGPPATLAVLFDNEKDGTSPTLSVDACKAVYLYYLQTGRQTYTVSDYYLTRRVRFHRDYSGHTSGIDPGNQLREVNAFAAAITTFAGVGSVPNVIGEGLADIQQDLSFPSAGYGATISNRGNKKFLKQDCRFDEHRDGTVDIFESWAVVDDVSATFYLDLDA